MRVFVAALYPSMFTSRLLHMYKHRKPVLQKEQQGGGDILEGTAQRRPFQFVVIWIGDAQSTYLRTLLVTSW